MYLPIGRKNSRIRQLCNLANFSIRFLDVCVRCFSESGGIVHPPTDQQDYPRFFCGREGGAMLLVLILGIADFAIITLSILQCCSKSQKQESPVVQEQSKVKTLPVEKTQPTPAKTSLKTPKPAFEIRKSPKDDEKIKTELESLRDEEYPFQKAVERKEKEKEKREIEGKVEQHFSKVGEKEKDLSVYSMDVKQLKKRDQGKSAEKGKQTSKEGNIGSADAERRGSQEKRGGSFERKASSAEAQILKKKEMSSQERKASGEDQMMKEARIFWNRHFNHIATCFNGVNNEELAKGNLENFFEILRAVVLKKLNTWRDIIDFLEFDFIPVCLSTFMCIRI
ncbi:unnamed protein product [Cylicocyclus nassatus]|uniref:Uncharacterized protein n=1 Tax=Cylicocyclus nassatus TaxID=53992 RepID=A0AA36DMD4_CYLNA|nr:unnamed protein product [Cylicocyclus nassatus]